MLRQQSRVHDLGNRRCGICTSLMCSETARALDVSRFRVIACHMGFPAPCMSSLLLTCCCFKAGHRPVSRSRTLQNVLHRNSADKPQQAGRKTCTPHVHHGNTVSSTIFQRQRLLCCGDLTTCLACRLTCTSAHTTSSGPAWRRSLPGTTSWLPSIGATWSWLLGAAALSLVAGS